MSLKYNGQAQNLHSVPAPETTGYSHPIHDGIAPADILRGEMIKAIITTDKSNSPTPVRVWRMSPLGIEIICDEFQLDLNKGDQISIELIVGKQVTHHTGLLVDSVHNESNHKVAGIRLFRNNKRDYSGQDTRKTNRFICSSQFYPSGCAKNPCKFNDFIYFKAADLSNNGMHLITSLRNKYLVKGMKISSIFNFPMTGDIEIKFEIVNVRFTRDNGKEYLGLGVRFINPSTKLLEIIGQYLFQFGDVSSLKELKDSNLFSGRISDKVDFRFVKNQEEYEKVLELRKTSYLAVNKANAEDSPESFSDIYDARSRIVIGEYNGNIIATSRLTFHENVDKFEQQEYIEWSHDLPRTHESLEIMRVCVHPDYQKTDVLLGMFHFNALTAVQSKRKYVVMSVTEEMRKFYSRIGFQDVNLSYEHPTLNNTVHNICIANVVDGMSGKNCDPVYWNIVWADVTSYLEEYDLISLDPAAKIRMNSYRLLKPFANYLRSRMRTPRKNK
ncbi:MAG: PilZ domain-containing protein [Bdellovibrionales bacterium]|nr:PilZ domain-containing protein [Bdellovibrionales bacterium]NQZ18028.1 PilZ domain-containing protein [Bdellovibrionales bacterium]